MPKYYTIPEFAIIKKTAVGTIYNAINKKDLDIVKVYDKQLIRRTKNNNKWKPLRAEKLFKQTRVNNMPDYHTITEFAKLKDTTRQTIYNAIKRNELDIVRLYGKQLLRNTKTNSKWMPVENQKRRKKKV